jgi:hypothetical protein
MFAFGKCFGFKWVIFWTGGSNLDAWVEED